MQMNEKTRKMIFATAGTLAGILIGCAVFLPSKVQPYAMVTSVVLWAAYLYRKLTKVPESKEKTMQIINLEPDFKKLYTQQVQHRVQERLRSKFPGATVDLCDAEILRIMTTGKMAYAPIRKADSYSHLGVCLGRNGELQMSLFSLVNLENIRESIPVEPVTISVVEDETQEVKDWYSQKGQQLLTELITQMHGRGYSKLSIKENGDVMVEENGRSVRKDFFSEIPPKTQWKALKELMEEDDVQVQVSGRRLTLAW